LNRSIELNPRQIEAYFNRAIVRESMARQGGSEKLLKQALEDLGFISRHIAAESPLRQPVHQTMDRINLALRQY
jgi:hypothetical protein